MKISSAFASSLEAPAHIAAAERLGYARAWLYDTPHQSPDVWMLLALAAQRTERIGLGPGVLVPSLRHPMVNAAGAAGLAALAPGRVAVAFGSGFTSARAMGTKPSTWAFLREYIAAFRGLLAGETVEWQGARIRMMHPSGHAPHRPIRIPIAVSATGPKGLGVARELGDGLFSVNEETAGARDFPWAALTVHGTVLAEGEALDSPHVMAAAGPGNALAYHFLHEAGADVRELPGGEQWLAVIERTDPQQRHLAIHEQHLVGLNEADRAAWDAGSWESVPRTTFTGTPEQLRTRLAELVKAGVTELIYQPTGPDIPAELKAFLKVAATV
ncbi:LLM class flavin-dependent oxidoreductase [Kitasatospora sp. NPDC048298]|uniref:LLM class flavin-dependent oxidoreductase n=1 Tax=Kitasatospora sp. NPDC048298 TaxID=3364049 RepID=UPI00370FB0EE